MFPSHIAMAAGLVGTSLISALLAVFITVLMPSRRRSTLPPLPDGNLRAVFLFDGHDLIDTTPAARRLLDGVAADGIDDGDVREAGGEWPRLAARLAPRFPGLAERVERLPRTGHFLLRPDPSVGGPTLEAEWLDGVMRITLDAFTGAEAEAGNLAQTAELATLRAVVNTSHVAIWTEDPDGAVRWANTAYLDLARTRLGPDEELGWPLPRLFERVAEVSGSQPHRVCLPGPDGLAQAFDLTVRRAPKAKGASPVPGWGGTLTCFATPADDHVAAERGRDGIVRTLASIFAHIPSGLAIFDGEWRLALVNPALSLITGLDESILDGKPSLGLFLDALRDRRRIPEQKDYRSWRASLLEAARSGSHSETWTLPDGRTLRVTIRPHAGDCIAFVFDDVTSEMAITRRFRSELELGQSIVDSLSEAIAVFSSTGSLLMSNVAYDRLWQCDTQHNLGEIRLEDAARHWQSLCAEAPDWEAFAGAEEGKERQSRHALALHTDGRRLSCRFTPLPGGTLLVGFAEKSQPRGMRQLASANAVQSEAEAAE
ncbi:PAS-domain containing protein [Tropicimonas sp. IMCC34011]|uniref:PAS-domain containing protein n=1 Tax=Tropicimonas sp. IMCC34011 TaxID=2248759 RepID=UPI000E2524D3|nr:PAS-domain containing protein [Tropicimonas sp. IMCC34011]